MSEHTAKVIDKTTWGEGPWLTEPDRIEWEHVGLPCLAVRGPHGGWCGYAAVPPGHVAHRKDYNDVDVEVHGGLTYAGLCSGDICHVPKPGEPDDVYWLGFDCAHSGDFSPKYGNRYVGTGYPWPAKPYDHEAAMADPAWQTEKYRTVDYVQAEVNRLAEQLARM